MIKNFQTAESSQRTCVNVARRTKFQNKETKAGRECFGADVLIAIAAALEPLTKMHLFQSPMEGKRRRYHEAVLSSRDLRTTLFSKSMPRSRFFLLPLSPRINQN